MRQPIRNAGRPTVLVTGGAGYIGSHAVLALLDGGWRVTVIDDLSTGLAAAVPDAARLVRGDIGDAALVRRVIGEDRVGAIMHFAGSIVVPESVTKPLFYYENNTVKSRSLIESAVACGVGHFIFSSTAATYGSPRSIPIREDDPLQPINPYGWSKLMTEQMLRDTVAAHPMNFCALRYFNVAGADPRGRSGQSSRRATHLIKIAVEAAVGGRSHVDVYGTDYPTPDGTCIRDYIHVSDLADAHVLALERLISAPGENLTLNCGYGRGHSVQEVLDSVDRVANRKLERRLGPRRAGDPPALVADNSRLLATLPWRPSRDDLDVIVADALSWEVALRERGQGGTPAATASAVGTRLPNALEPADA